MVFILKVQDPVTVLLYLYLSSAIDEKNLCFNTFSSGAVSTFVFFTSYALITVFFASYCTTPRLQLRLTNFFNVFQIKDMENHRVARQLKNFISGKRKCLRLDKALTESRILIQPKLWQMRLASCSSNTHHKLSCDKACSNKCLCHVQAATQVTRRECSTLDMLPIYWKPFNCSRSGSGGISLLTFCQCC